LEEKVNVVIALIVVAIVGAIGGIGHAVITYGGTIFPKKDVQTVKVGPANDQKDVEVTLWLPGVVGEAFIGLLSGLLVFCVYAAPTEVVAASTTVSLTFYSIGTILLAGLGGTAAINQLVEKNQWSKLAPVLEQSDPATRAIATTGGAKPREVLKMLAAT
jgi:hypothetical protein